MPKFIFIILFLAICALSAVAQKYISPDVVETTVINREELNNLVKSPAEKQPILINFWATWCGPCRAEFPDLVEIDKDFRDRGLNFFVVSIDKVLLVDTTVSNFLKSYEAEMPSYLLEIYSRGEMLKAVRQIAPRFSGGIPFTALFDANGKLVYQKNGVIDAKVLRARIEKVLPKKRLAENK